MVFLALGIVFAGYDLLWYGFANIIGPKGSTAAPGFMDLLKPSQEQKCQAWWSASSSSSSSNSSGSSSRGKDSGGPGSARSKALKNPNRDNLGER